MVGLSRTPAYAIGVNRDSPHFSPELTLKLVKPDEVKPQRQQSLQHLQGQIVLSFQNGNTNESRAHL